MASAKVAISLDSKALRDVDRLVRRGAFPSRSRLIQEAVVEKLDRLERSRLAIEAAKLDKKVERALADQGLTSEASWPEY